MNQRMLMLATAIGVAAQLAMVLAGHYVPAVQAGFMWGGLGLSLLAGLVYGWRAGQAWVGSALGGLIAGGVCALIGIVVSHVLGDVPTAVIVFGTVGSAVSGAVGGAIGKLLPS